MHVEDLAGRDTLVGITYFNPEGEVRRQEQFHGPIEEANSSITLIRPSTGGDLRWLPTDLAAFRPAPGGTYRLKSTGQVVMDPELITSWMLTDSQDEQGEFCYEVEPNLAPLVQSRVPQEWDLSYVADEARIRQTIDAYGDEYIGRSLLLGVNVLEPDGTLLRQEQLFGTIMVVRFDEGIVVSCEPDGRSFVLPGDPAWIAKAPRAEYRLRSTGQVIIDPDYLARVSITQHPS